MVSEQASKVSVYVCNSPEHIGHENDPDDEGTDYQADANNAISGL